MISTISIFNKKNYAQENFQIKSQNTSKKVLISVLIPVFKRETLVFRAIKSCIESQLIDKYKIPIQIVAIDDCSTENSYSALEYSKKYYENNSTYRKYVSIDILRLERNRGTLYTRLKAFSIATGEYIMSVDPDDEILPGMMNRLLQLTKNRPDIDIIQFRLLKVTYNRVRYMQSGTVKVMVYGEYPFEIMKWLTLTEPLGDFKFHLLRENNQQLDIDKLNTSHKFNHAQMISMMQASKIMWNLPGLFIKAEIMSKGVQFLQLDLNTLESICGYEDKLIAYACYYFCNVFYYLDEIGYFYYRGVPMIKRQKSEQLSRIFQDFQQRTKIAL